MRFGSRQRAFESVITDNLKRIGARRRVILSREAVEPPESDPGTIASRVPEARVDWPRKGLVGRRRTLSLVRAGSALVFQARLRPAPPHLDPASCAGVVARDRRGRPVPAALVDRDRRAVHVLVGPLLRDADADPESLASDLCRALVDDPLQTLLEEQDGVSVGAEVSERLRRLVAAPAEAARESLSVEIDLVNRARSRDPFLFGALAPRLERALRALERADDRRARARVTDAWLEREVGRLARLVASRALREIRFGPSAMTAVANPSEEGIRMRRAITFRIPLSPLGPAVVGVWAGAVPPAMLQHVCVGDGAAMLYEFAQRQDLYAMLDVFLNYIDSNPRAVPWWE